MKSASLTIFVPVVIMACSCTRVSTDQATKYPTVKAMIESFNDFSEIEGTFHIVSEEPLHIELSPTISPGDPSDVIERRVMDTMIYGIYRTFIHTPVQRVTVTVLPQTLTIGRHPKLTPSLSSTTVTKTREEALILLRKFFPTKDFSDLVTTENISGVNVPDGASETFNRIRFPDQGTPGVDTFYRELSK